MLLPVSFLSSLTGETIAVGGVPPSASAHLNTLKSAREVIGKSAENGALRNLSQAADILASTQPRFRA